MNTITTSITTSDQSLFDFNGHPVRVISKEGAFHFVASDIADALGHRDALTAIRYLDDDEKGYAVWRIRSDNGVEQDRELLTVNESGLYGLIFRGRKAEAKAFRRWVTGTVLPTLRQHGLYVVGEEKPLPENMTEEEATAALEEHQRAAAQLQARLAAIVAERAAQLAAARAAALERREDRDFALQQLKRISNALRGSRKHRKEARPAAHCSRPAVSL